MKIRRTISLTAAIAVLVWLPLSADWPVTEKLDLDAIYRIKDEGLQRSKVMEIESYLTDVYGPRLTNSPEIKEAAEYAQKTMRELSRLSDRLEAWGAAFLFGAFKLFSLDRASVEKARRQNHRRIEHRRSRRAHAAQVYPTNNGHAFILRNGSVSPTR